MALPIQNTLCSNSYVSAIRLLEYKMVLFIQYLVCLYISVIGYMTLVQANYRYIDIETEISLKMIILLLATSYYEDISPIICPMI